MNYRGHAGNQYTGSEGEQGFGTRKGCNIKTGMDGTWILLLSYYLNLRKMNFTYQVINCTNVGNFRIFSMLKGFQTGKGGEGGCQVFQGG